MCVDRSATSMQMWWRPPPQRHWTIHLRFESMGAEAWLGTAPPVVWGGIATVAVVYAIAALSPSLRKWRNEPVKEALAAV